MSDRFEVVYSAALDLLEAGRKRRATVLLEQLGLLHPPKDGESGVYYQKIHQLLKTLCPEGSEIWACDVSPDGFCRRVEEAACCMFCGEPVERK